MIFLIILIFTQKQEKYMLNEHILGYLKYNNSLIVISKEMLKHSR